MKLCPGCIHICRRSRGASRRCQVAADVSSFFASFDRLQLVESGEHPEFHQNIFVNFPEKINVTFFISSISRKMERLETKLSKQYLNY